MAEVETLSANSAEELEALRIKYLSKKGAINDLMADFRNVPADQKKEVGMRLNALKTRATERIAELKEAFETNDSGAAEMDLTRTAYPVELGTRHPLSIVKNEIIDIFARMGFALADGPEVEDDWHVFSSMNFAEDHPARDRQDTFFIEAHPDIILRTHTSSVQSRVMENAEPPIRIICPGRVCRNVLELNGIDSKVYSGYALGMGIERITNLKHQVKDLRMFSENDVRFLKEFEAAN